MADLCWVEPTNKPASEWQWSDLRSLHLSLRWSRSMFLAWLASFRGGHPEFLTWDEAIEAVRELRITLGISAA